MPGPLTIKEILARNPQIDPDQLAKARELLRKLRERGVRPKGYELAPPFGGRRVGAHTDENADKPILRPRRAHGAD